MIERLPAICPPDAISGAYRPGLRIAWESDEGREVWEIISVEGDSVTTRVTTPDGGQRELTSRFAELSDHSSFPVGTLLTKEDFSTPAGRFHGSHAVVATSEGTSHFYFSDDHPGPPMKIESDSMLRQQVERSDV